MADVYFVVVVAEYWAVMLTVAAAVATATPAVIVAWMALEKSVMSLFILLWFRLVVLVSSSSLSATLFFDPYVAIVLVILRL